MIRQFLVISMLTAILGCNYPMEKNFTGYRSHYCYNDGGNQMDIIFRTQNDTVFLLYVAALDSGKYINGYVDSLDFAGYFLPSKVEDSSVQMKIKNYRDESFYTVDLMFDNNKGNLTWSIDSGLITYLPKRAIFKNCE